MGEKTEKKIYQMILKNDKELKKMTYNELQVKYNQCTNMTDGEENKEQAGILLRVSLQYFTSMHFQICCNRSKDKSEAEIYFKRVGKHLAILFKDEAFNTYKTFKKQENGKKDSWSDTFVNDTDLLILTILMNWKDCILSLLKKKGKKNIIYEALYASALLKSLSHLAESQEQLELGTTFMENSRYFETLACNVISEIFHEDRATSHELLITLVEGYGCTAQTVMKLAASNELMQFMGTTACQTKLNGIWKGNMSHFTSPKKIIACTFFPFLIPSIKFVSHDMRKQRIIKIICCDHSVNDPSESDPVVNDPSESDPGDSGQTKSILNIMYYFYNAPITKFWTYMIAYFVMVCSFATFVLTDLHPLSAKQPSFFEIFTLLWISTVLLEEIRQIWNYEQYSVWYKVQSWWRNAWNKFDAAMYFCFLLAFTLRVVCSDEDFRWAVMAYSISLAVFILRTLHFFYVAKYTGPKVIMIGKMVSDLQFFIMIFVVVLVSFGIITQANLFPNSVLEWKLLTQIVYLPYWQLYGELFLDNIEGREPSTCTTELSLYSNGTLPRCPESNALVPLVLAIYMVFTNILLINLVIAMFSDTFQKVHANSVLVWKFYRYSLVYEYYERPALIPPLIILNHLYRILRFLIRRNSCGNNYMNYENAFQKEPSSQNSEKDKLEATSIVNVLKNFGTTANSTLSSSRSYYSLSNASTTDANMNEVLKRLENMERHLQQLHDEVQYEKGHPTNAKKGKKKTNNFYIDVKDSADA